MADCLRLPFWDAGSVLVITGIDGGNQQFGDPNSLCGRLLFLLPVGVLARRSP